MGVGRALLRATLTFAAVEADEIWVEAQAPVMTRAATAVRTISFMLITSRDLLTLQNFSLDRSAEVNI
ncbi:hypothetical protein BDD14_2705 [Edaphobacter modestus]|uniref:Uncharacterized protein n=1 Tax=Edaphobacter modestus TaxID=388466 RepID=A0A4Q7YVM2_9BACT|nr:hypothetical protein BDD14_2705 [Edaphobacter modestus]